MQIIVVEGVPYHWVQPLQEIHAHVFEGAHLTLEKLESKKDLLCLFAVEKQEMIGFKLGYPHSDGVFIVGWAVFTKKCEVKVLLVN